MTDKAICTFKVVRNSSPVFVDHIDAIRLFLPGDGIDLMPHKVGIMEVYSEDMRTRLMPSPLQCLNAIKVY